jgi:hypothetical protein
LNLTVRYISLLTTRPFFLIVCLYLTSHASLEKYYEGITSAQLSSQDSTPYKWGFAKNVDQHELDSVRDSVDTMTNSQKKLKDAREAAREAASDSRRVRRNVGPSLPSSSGRYQSGNYSRLRIQS